MKPLVFILLMLLCFQGKVTAQQLTNGTLSSCTIQGEQLTGIMGDANAFNLENGTDRLAAGFIEALLAEAEEITEEPDVDPTNPPTPPDDEDDEDEEKDPTAIETIQESLQIAVCEQQLTIHSLHPFDVEVYHLSGYLVLRKSNTTEVTKYLAKGIYLVVILDLDGRKIYKVSAH